MTRAVLTLDEIDRTLILQALHERAREYKRRQQTAACASDGDQAEHCRIRSEQCARLVRMLSDVQAPMKIAGRP